MDLITSLILRRVVLLLVGALVVGATCRSYASDLSYTDAITTLSNLPSQNVGIGPPAVADVLNYTGTANLTGPIGGTLSLTNAQVVVGGMPVQGGTSPNHATPYGLSATTPYLAAYGSGGFGNGIAVFTFNSPIAGFAFDWGTPDLANYLTVNTISGASLTINGGSLAGYCPAGNQDCDFAGHSDVITITSALADITSITFDSGQNSFEAGAFQVSPVPLPGALPLFGAGLVGLGVLGWRKARRKAS